MMSKRCKKAASIIVIGKSLFSNSILKSSSATEKVSPFFDYKILVVKRASKSSFMPNGVVFPGGVFHEADGNRGWLELYRKMSPPSSRTMYPFTLNDSREENKIRANNVLSFSDNGNYLPDNFAFRINAIRELFEECGLLLAKKSQTQFEKGIESGWASFLHSHEILHWKERVQRDPHEFMKLCEHFMCLPDVWSLKDWNFWLTPTHLPSARFDTAFFVAAISQIPPTVADEMEVTELKWMTPNHLLEDYESHCLWLPPPQFYEISRIAKNFHKAQEFLDFSNVWSGCQRWMPVGIKAADGWVYLLPGDEMYPDKPVYYPQQMNNKMKVNKSELQMLDLRQKCSKLHRLEIKDPHDVNIIINHHPSPDHVYPELMQENSKY